MKSSYYKLSFATILLPLIFSSVVNAQETTLPDIAGNRYRLDIPRQWLKKPKLLNTINVILPKALPELRNLDFCTEGKSKYTINFYFDSLRVMNQNTTLPVDIGGKPHYTFSFDYSFYSAFVVSDSTGRPFVMLRLNSTEEINNYSKEYTMAPQNVIYQASSIYTSQARSAEQRTVQNVRPVTTSIPRHSASSVLTGDFLLKVCESKIHEIEKTLKTLSIQYNLP